MNISSFIKDYNFFTMYSGKVNILFGSSLINFKSTFKVVGKKTAFKLKYILK